MTQIHKIGLNPMKAAQIHKSNQTNPETYGSAFSRLSEPTEWPIRNVRSIRTGSEQLTLRNGFGIPQRVPWVIGPLAPLLWSWG